MIALPSVAWADPPSPKDGQQAGPAIQTPAIDPITGLAYGTPPSVNGVAMAVDAEGHPRAFCADPNDSLAPAALRDAIQPTISRLRYE